MKIRAITLSNVRRFTYPVQVDGIGDGLNVLCEPNEFGKSTLFDALQAVFFKPHGSRDKDIVALRPHAGGAPEVSVEVETGDGLFTVTKRWLQKPVATVHKANALVAQSDAAEAWISDLLGGDAGGPSGLIWVRQGMTGLTGNSKKEEAAALEARRDLMTSVGEEVEAMTGGRRMDMALARCREELALYATSSGRPKTNGPWKDAQDAVATLTEERDGLANTARELHDALAERKRARRELADWEDPQATEDRRARLEAARATHQAAERHAEAVATAARKAEMARLNAENLRARLDACRAARVEQAEVAALLAQAETKAKEALAGLDAARTERDRAEAVLATAIEHLKQAEAAQNHALRARAARDGAARRKELQDRLTQAEKMRQTAEEAEAAARSGPDAATLRRIETLAQTHATALAARNATATQVIARYRDGRTGGIRAEGTPLAEGATLPVPRATVLEIDGIGTLEIRPAETASDGTVEAAAAALQKAMSAIGAETLDAARAAAATRAEAERTLGEAKAALAGLAPDGIAALREALARIPMAEDDGADALDPADAEAALEAARAAQNAAQIARETAADRFADARDGATRAETELASLRDRLRRAEDAVARTGGTSEADLEAQTIEAEAALATANADHAGQAAAAPDLETTAATLKRAESVDHRAREEITRLKLALERLNAKISHFSGDAVEERLADIEAALVAAEATLSRIAQEVAVLRRLETALETARNEARERYFTPIARELKPLLHLLWPEAELTWGEETLLPDALVRDGQTEPIDVLSGGTQEQVALLVRLAFARMLANTGRSAPVILDDALVYTDDDRIERMFDALHRQAGDLQILVLTCRQRAFRDLGGHALRLTRDAQSN